MLWIYFTALVGIVNMLAMPFIVSHMNKTGIRGLSSLEYLALLPFFVYSTALGVWFHLRERARFTTEASLYKVLSLALIGLILFLVVNIGG